MFVTKDEAYRISVKALESLAKCNSYCKAVEYLSDLTDEDGVGEIVKLLAEKAMAHAETLSQVNILPDCVLLASLAAKAAMENAEKAMETAYGLKVIVQHD